MKTEQMEFRFEEGELVAPVSHLYKGIICNFLEKTVAYGDVTLVHKLLTEVMKDSLKYDDFFKKTPKQFQEEVLGLLNLPYETVYEMINDKPCPRKEEEEVPKLRLVK